MLWHRWQAAGFDRAYRTKNSGYGGLMYFVIVGADESHVRRVLSHELQDPRSILRLHVDASSGRKAYDKRAIELILSERVHLQPTALKDYSWQMCCQNGQIACAFDHRIFPGKSAMELLQKLSDWPGTWPAAPHIKFWPGLREVAAYRWLRSLWRLPPGTIGPDDKQSLRIFRYKMKDFRKSAAGATSDFLELFGKLIRDSLVTDVPYLNILNLGYFDSTSALSNKLYGLVCTVWKEDTAQLIMERIREWPKQVLGSCFLAHFISGFSMLRGRIDICLSSLRVYSSERRPYDISYPGFQWGVYIFNVFCDDTLEGVIHVRTESIDTELLIEEAQRRGMEIELDIDSEEALVDHLSAMGLSMQ